MLPFPESKLADAGGVQLAYREWGDPAASSDASPTILLLHGITSSALSWARVGPALGETHHVIAPDLKGHGDSDRHASGYRHDLIAAEVEALCRALGLEHVALIGHSWGGALGVVLATESDLVARLILEDPVLYLSDEQRARFAADYAQTVGLRLEEARRLYNAGTVPAGWTEEDIEGKVDAVVKGSPDAVRAVFRENDPWDLADLLERLTCQTLLLYVSAEAGGLVHPDIIDRAGRLPHVRMLTIPNADHNIHRTAFDAFMHEVRAFL